MHIVDTTNYDSYLQIFEGYHQMKESLKGFKNIRNGWLKTGNSQLVW